ncbi:hypothetical protein IX51_09545 [uncultured archaeon]|nr:hypothetical protein IX51_09545 [uncultured archaeon]
MTNRELASLFQDLADMEEIEGNRWESLAYGKVALSIATLVEDVGELRKKDSLRNIEGVGAAIEKKIIEYLETGHIEKHVKMKEKYPIDFPSLRNIQGLGPKRIALLHRELGIKNVDDLEKALEEGAISSVPGFGKKSEESLRRSLEVHRRTGSNRLFLALVYDDIHRFLSKVRDNGYFLKADIAGSTRRNRETIGDIDILAVCTDNAKCTEFFLSLDEVEDVVVRGETKVSVRLSYGINCDLRIVDPESYGAAMQYFTGSKEHNIKMRDLAIEQNLKLNEYGLFSGEKSVAGKTEEEVYEHLGLSWVPPELRENMGELEAARGRSLPTLIEHRDVRGDFHAHTNASDGTATLEEMVEKAKSLGYDYIALTEHSASLRIANGLDEKRFNERNVEIDKINESDRSIRILKGVELEIRKDGTLDLPYKLLEEMDVVVGALHQWVGDNITENTNRVVKALNSGHIFTLAHPTGRLIGVREPYRLDFEKIFQACEENNVSLEINGYPERSDLPYDLVKRAREYDLKFTLGSDSHRTDHLRFLRFATSIARRGWLEKNDVMNTSSCHELFAK